MGKKPHSDNEINLILLYCGVRTGNFEAGSHILVLTFLMVAGMNLGTQPGAEFNEVETALENAIAGK